MGELSTENNPLRMIHDATWRLIEASTQITGMFEVGNRIKHYGGQSEPIIDTPGAGDLPEIRLIQTGLKSRPYRTTSQSSLHLWWSLQMTTGEQASDTLLDAQWNVYRALLLWDTTVKGLRWQGNTFVDSARFLRTKDSLNNDRQNRGTRGWSTLWAGYTRCWFLNHDLRGGR